MEPHTEPGRSEKLGREKGRVGEKCTVVPIFSNRRAVKGKGWFMEEIQMISGKGGVLRCDVGGVEERRGEERKTVEGRGTQRR